MMPPRLPEGLTARPPTMADVEAATALLRADEAHSAADVHTTAEDIRSDWSRPSMDLSHDVILVHDDERLVGYADHSAGRGWVAVHPDAHGRGLGTWLLHWTEQRARQDGQPRVGQTVAEVHTSAVELLRRNGYTQRWDSWVFTIPLTDDLPAPALADGLSLRPMVRPDDDAAVHGVIETAFGEWPDRETGTSLEDWRAANLDRDDAVALVVVDDRSVRSSVPRCASTRGPARAGSSSWRSPAATAVRGSAVRCCTPRSATSAAAAATGQACRRTRAPAPRRSTSTSA